MNMEPKCRASSSSNSNSAGTSTLANLPKEVLVLVMRKLSPRQRFGGCALTCRALLAAAVAATQELQLSNISQQRADSIALWLAKHSRTALLKLDLEGIRPGNGRMPVNLAVPFQILAHLQSLRLQSLAVQAQSGIGGSVGSLRQLAMLSSLQRLQLSHLQPFISSTKVMSPSPVCAVTIAANSAGLGAALCQLVQLTALVLTAGHTWPLSGHVLAKASCLSRLQYLSLGYVGTAEHPVELQDLPDSLISVNLNTVHLGSIQTVSSSWQLSGLQRLTLNWTQAEPALLLRMPQLQTLYWFPSENLVLEKMPVLPMLVQLQYLRTIHLDCMASAADVADYAALTANSQLEELWLENLSLAAPAIAHIFPVGRRLPQLRTLQTAGLNVLWDEFEKRGLLLGPSSAGQIAACCPALQALGVLIVDTALAAADLQPLLQLSALTHLELGGEGCDDAVAEQLLAKLTGLVRLKVRYCPKLTAAGCAHLTGLRALKQLLLQHCGAFAAASNAEGSNADEEVVLCYTHLTEEGNSAVWSQLQHLCERHPAGLAALYRHAQQRIAAQEQQLREQEQQLQHARQQLAQLSQHGSSMHLHK